MTRMLAIVIALAVCLAGVEAALFSAGILGHWLQAHMVARWFAPACNVFVFGILGIVGLFSKKEKPVEEDTRLTPLVRRDPKTGLRQL